MEESTRGPFESASIPEAYRRFLQPAIFEPWAARLIDFVGLHEGQTVLDVASGTGAVARAAARTVGPRGRVIASDISTGMLTNVAIGAHPADAPIELLESPATAIALSDAAVDVALCQQGFPFIRGSASGKMSMSETDVQKVLSAGGFVDVEVTLQELVLQWPSVAGAAAGISGTPYWPVVESLEEEPRNGIIGALQDVFSGSDGQPLLQTTTAVLGRGTVAA